MTIKMHEEYASLIPPISESEYKVIKESIKDNGQDVPIIINLKGEILDGHTRARVQQELEREPITYTTDKYEDPLLAKQFIININRNRRHLTPFQRIELQYKLEPIEAELAKKRQIELAATRPNKKDSLSDNPTLVRERTKVSQAIGRVIDIAATKAYEVNSDLYKQEILIILYLKVLGDFAEQSNQIRDNSVDMIYVDPPYNEEWLPNYDELSKVAAKVLIDGGSIVTYCNQDLKYQIINFMKSSGLTYWWELAVIHEGPFDKLFPKHVIVTWKPLLLFVKGSKLITCEFFKDSVQSQHPDKTLNDWAQSTAEAEYYISKLTSPNDIVLDPTMGSGTTGIAALNQKRQYIGIEKVPDVFTKTKASIADAAAVAKEKVGA